MFKNKNLLIVSFLVSFITILVYLPTLQNDFVNWDDPYYVYENKHIQSLNLRFVNWIFKTFHAGNWHPLTLLSHAMDYALWGLNPLGHHLTSIIFHGLNTFLVFIIVTHLLNCFDDKRQGTLIIKNKKISFNLSLLAPVTTALIFGIHPLHVESVSWISERKDVLCAFFFLLAILSYLSYTYSEVGKRKKSYFLCLSFFIFALMSKPMAVTLPVVLIIMDIYPLERLKVKQLFTLQRRVLIEKIPFFALSLFSLIITMLAQQSVSAIKPLKSLVLGDRILMAFRGICFYLYKILWPRDLAPLYPYPMKITFFMFDYFVSIAMVLIVTVFSIYLWRKQKIWFTVWAYYLITLLPVLGIVQVGDQAAADRYTYLPSLGPFILIGIGTTKLIGKALNEQHEFVFKKIIIIVLILLTPFVMLVDVTIKQEKVWKDSITLWKREIALFPDNTEQAYYNLGNAYMSRGLTNQAIKQYQVALKINPYYLHAYNSLGKAFQSKELLDTAITYYEYVLKLKNDFPDGHINLGNAYQLKGLHDEAIREYKIALQFQPDSPEAHNNLGLAFQSKGLYEIAIRQYQKAIELSPDFSKAHKNIGFAYFVKGNKNTAIQHLEYALKLTPDDAQAHLNIALVLKSQGFIDKANKHFRIARQLNPTLFKVENTKH
jgi:tetratricopeptide (TPR) repeat protein